MWRSKCWVNKVTALTESDGFGVAVVITPEVVAGSLNIIPVDVEYWAAAH